MKYNVSLVTMLALASLTVAAASAQSQQPAMPKKLIEYGWDVPAPDFVRAHIREMEQRPFDGLIFRLQSGSNVLEPAPWDEARFAGDFDNCTNIAWEKFTDNFVIVLAASNQDWFDDGQWTAIEHNVRIVAKAAKLARCAGLCFDAEPYGTNPWAYSNAAHRDTKTFAEYQTVVRARGAQFMKAIESEFPSPKILTFYLLGLFAEFCKPMPADARFEQLAAHGYAFVPAFFNGMLEAASPGALFVDGNENAYYYTNSASYFEMYQCVTQRARYLVDPALWSKYRAQVQSGHALYIDQYYGLRAEKVLGNYLTPKEQPKWFEHNTYWALNVSDQYVWCYSERMNWWTNTAVPAGAEDALRAARAKVAAGEPLGFDIRPLLEAGAKREHGETRP